MLPKVEGHILQAIGDSSVAITDVCSTPISGGSVPTPYPNIAFNANSSDNMPQHLLVTVGEGSVSMSGSVVSDALIQFAKDSTAQEQVRDLSLASDATDVVVHINYGQPLGGAKLLSNGVSTDFQCTRLTVHFSPNECDNEDYSIKSVVPCEKHMPETRFLNSPGQNGAPINAPGVSLTPSQIRIVNVA